MEERHYGGLRNAWYTVSPRRLMMLIAATLLAAAPRLVAAQSAPIPVKAGVVPMPMPGGLLPRIPIPAAIPGPLPAPFDSSPGAVVSGLPLDWGRRGRRSAPPAPSAPSADIANHREAKAGRVARARRPEAAELEAALARLREAFGLDKASPKESRGENGTSPVFDGVAEPRPKGDGYAGIPERDLKRDLGVK